jgi:hypothetical protein
MTNLPVPIVATATVAWNGAAVPALLAAAGERASVRFLEFFAANIRNPHTRRAYYRAAEEFLTWCASVGVPSIAAVRPVHVAAWIEAATRELAAPSIKQRLAAIRHLFDWLVTGQVVPVNPAGSVRGPRHVVTCGQTPVLDPAEARTLLDSIDTSTPAGSRLDRAHGRKRIRAAGLITGGTSRRDDESAAFIAMPVGTYRRRTLPQLVRVLRGPNGPQ